MPPPDQPTGNQDSLLNLDPSLQGESRRKRSPGRKSQGKVKKKDGYKGESREREQGSKSVAATL